MERDPNDPKGLIRESYRIENISLEECRSVFLDWALSLPAEKNNTEAIEALLENYRAGNPADHPMTQVLEEGLQTMAAPKRRGGWKSRRRQ